MNKMIALVFILLFGAGLNSFAPGRHNLPGLTVDTAREYVEAHPELSFAEMARRPLGTKKTAAGPAAPRQHQASSSTAAASARHDVKWPEQVRKPLRPRRR